MDLIGKVIPVKFCSDLSRSRKSQGGLETANPVKLVLINGQHKLLLLILQENIHAVYVLAGAGFKAGELLRGSRRD